MVSLLRRTGEDLHLDGKQRCRPLVVAVQQPSSLDSIQGKGAQLKLFSDTTPKGWGGHQELQEVEGLWTPAEHLHHINVLELLAAFRNLQHFRTQIQGKTILLLDLLIDFPLELPLSYRMLKQPQLNIFHCDPAVDRLYAWKLSPCPSKRKAFLRRLQHEWPTSLFICMRKCTELTPHWKVTVLSLDIYAESHQGYTADPLYFTSPL